MVPDNDLSRKDNIYEVELTGMEKGKLGQSGGFLRPLRGE